MYNIVGVVKSRVTYIVRLRLGGRGGSDFVKVVGADFLAV